MYIQKRKSKRIAASEEFDDEMIVEEDDVTMDEDVDVDPAASDLLFEAEDVAELVAEVTGEPVSVEVSDEDGSVTFTVSDTDFIVEAEGDEEVLESRRINRKAKKVQASRRTAPKRTAPRRDVKASKNVRKPIRRMPKSK